MLRNAQKPKPYPLMSPPSAVSVGLSNRLDAGWRPEKQVGQELITRIPPPEIEATQRLLARIAVRIITQRRRDEK